MATKKKAAAEGVARPKALAKPTLVHIVYHPEEGIVGGSVQQDVTILGETSRHGRDRRIAVADLPTDIQKHLDAAFAGVAKELGATT
jgi:hypothetical protein